MVSALSFAAGLWWQFIIGLGTVFSATEVQLSHTDDYEKGLGLRNDGHWEEALNTWWSACNQLELRGESDPRIGIAFIELATEKEANQYYGTASEMYMWGFSRKATKENRNAVVDETKRIIPLLEGDQADRWRKLMKQKSPHLSDEIRLFWLEKDSRPATPVNERLIEHWLRINHARRAFKKNRMSVYGCDDRGTIYVKYGHPWHIKSGHLGTSGASQLELMRWYGPSARATIRSENPAPEYELWLYDDIDTDDPTYFLFSLRDGTGTFGLRDGIEATIGGRTSRRYIFQIMYYAELETFALDLEQRYRRLEDAWQRGGRVGRKLMKSHFATNKIVDRANPAYKFADADKSDYEQSVGSVNLVARNVRLLDDTNKPMLAVIAISSPQFKGEALTSKEGIFEIPAYKLHHTLIIRDESLRQTKRMAQVTRAGTDNIALFHLQHSTDYSHFTIASEARMELSDTLLAMGKTFLRTDPALNPDPNSLEVSDLVLGVALHSGSAISDQLPLPVLPSYRFSKSDPMQVYLEVYHLQPDRDGDRRFLIEFAVHKLDDRGRKRKKDGEISLRFEFEAAGPTSKEYSGINLSKLSAGDYELSAKVRDLSTGQEKRRTNRFGVEK